MRRLKTTKGKLLVAIALCVLAATIGASALKYALGPGTGGPDTSTAPLKYALGPGTGGPDSVATPLKYSLGPGTGGPDSITE